MRGMKALVWLKRWQTCFRQWQHNYRSRRLLASMTDHQLKDIGLTHGEQYRESSKLFWHG